MHDLRGSLHRLAPRLPATACMWWLHAGQRRLTAEHRQRRAVGGEAHAVRDCVLHPQELRHQRLQLGVQRRVAALGAAAAGADAPRRQRAQQARRIAQQRGVTSGAVL